MNVSGGRRFLDSNNFVDMYIDYLWSEKVGAHAWKRRFIKKIFKVLVGESLLDNAYEGRHEEDYIEFAKRLYSEIGFHYNFFDQDIDKVPKDGPVIFVANHSLGLADWVVLIALLKVRQDVKMVASDLLTSYDQTAKNYVIGVPLSGRNQSSAIHIVKQLKRGGAVLLFPSGRVSGFATPYAVYDGRWNSNFCRFAEKANASIVPLHINGRLSDRYYHLVNKGGFREKIAHIRLVREMFGLKGKSVEITVGNAIQSSELNKIPIDNYAKAVAIREQVYILEGIKNATKRKGNI